MAVVLIFWPSKANPAFIPEMSNLHTTLYFITSASTTGKVTLADLNIHVDTPSFHFATNFIQLLDTSTYDNMLMPHNAPGAIHASWTSITSPQSAICDFGVKWEVWPEPLADGFLSHSSLVQVYHLLTALWTCPWWYRKWKELVQLETHPFFISEQTWKFSRGWNTYFPNLEDRNISSSVPHDPQTTCGNTSTHSCIFIEKPKKKAA